jgi:predicted nucleic acid-binding protein
MKEIVVDASAIIAVILNEPEKSKIIDISDDSLLIAPSSIHWEIGNAISAMFKRKRLKYWRNRKVCMLMTLICFFVQEITNHLY